MNNFNDISKKNAFLKQRNNMRIIDSYIGYSGPKDLLIADTLGVHVAKFITNFNLEAIKENNGLLLVDPLSTVGFLLKDADGTCFHFIDRNTNDLYIGDCYSKKDSYHLDGAVISQIDDNMYQVGIFSYLPKNIGELTNECAVGLTTFCHKPEIIDLKLDNNFNSKDVLKIIKKLSREIRNTDYYEDVTNIDYQLIGDIAQFINICKKKNNKNILR